MGRGGRGSWDEPEGGLAVPALQVEPMLASLHGHGADFVIIGGFCLFAHGVVRATKDVDIVPAPDPANLGRLAAALSSIEAVPLLGVSLSEAGLALGGNWVLRTRHGRLDVMQAVEGVRDYAGLRARAVSVEVPGAGPCWFASLDDLIAMKTAAGRPQDRIDVASLERARGAG